MTGRGIVGVTLDVLLAAAVGVVGLSLLVLRSAARLDGVGLAAAIGGMATVSLATVLGRRWGLPAAPTRARAVLALTSWQLIAGGVLLLPVALAIDGPPPSLAVALGIVLVHLSLWLSMRFSLPILRVIRESGVMLVSRISGLLLSAIAVQLVVDAVRAFLHGQG